MITEAAVETIRRRWETRGREIVRRTLADELEAVLRVGPAGIVEYRWFDALWTLWNGAGSDAAELALADLEEKALADLVPDVSEIRRVVARRARQATTRSLEAVASLAARATAAETRLLYQSTLGESAIVRTVAHEVVSATAWAQQAAARTTGRNLVKIWNTVGDERVRPSHAAASGQRRRLDTFYLVGGAALMHPGDPAGPIGETINCRCFETYQVVDRLPPRRGLGSIPPISVPETLLPR